MLVCDFIKRGHSEGAGEPLGTLPARGELSAAWSLSSLPPSLIRKLEREALKRSGKCGCCTDASADTPATRSAGPPSAGLVITAAWKIAPNAAAGATSFCPLTQLPTVWNPEAAWRVARLRPLEGLQLACWPAPPSHLGAPRGCRALPRRDGYGQRSQRRLTRTLHGQPECPRNVVAGPSEHMA